MVHKMQDLTQSSPSCIVCEVQALHKMSHKTYPFGIVHEVQALHKLMLGEEALISCYNSPHILQSALRKAPLHECPKAVASLQVTNQNVLPPWM